MYYRKNNITHQEPIEGIKLWILLGYPSNILGYQSRYCNYFSKRKLGRFPHSPWSTPPVDNFFNIHLTKNIMNIQDVEFDFRMGCIPILFPFFTNN